jgi:ERCC4-related helicase
LNLRGLDRRHVLQSIDPVVGAHVWIRQARWRIEAWRRHQGVIRLDVLGRRGRLTFLAPFDHPCFVVGDRLKRVRPQELRARFASLVGRETTHRSLSSPIDGHLEILPFQFEPALAVLNGARRVLIADEVGLGKTIQAGLILAELHRRHPALRALILTPASLRHQWVDELRQRFDVRAWSADALSFERSVRPAGPGGAAWDQPGVWVASFDYLKQPHVVEGMPRRPWDLLVMDEAHGACGNSWRHATADDLARSSRCLLLLTATPHSGDESRFERLLDLGVLPCQGDELLIFRRTRAGLGLSAARRVRWQTVPLSPEEERLLDALTVYEQTVLRAAGEGRRNTALLLLSVFRKRALSTIAAFLVSVQRRLTWLEASGAAEPEPWRQTHLDFEEDADDMSLEERLSFGADIGLEAERERSCLRRLHELGRAALSHDSKIRRVLALARRSNEPLAIFTEFTDSLDALAARLRPSHRFAAIHGRLTSAEQRQQLDRFLDGSARILLATDVASQGLNLQSRCRWVVNLELPWNPVKLEQRAGRVDRIGQRRGVHISLLVAGHPAESGVLARLARRTLAAQQRLGPETLRGTAPDEHLLRVHLLANAPLPPAETPRRMILICRAWSRQARAAAGRLRRQRTLAAHWRPRTQPGRPCAGRLETTGALRSIAARSALLLFSVPLTTESGALLERRLVLVRAPVTVLRHRQEVDRAREAAGASLRSRARRLRRRQARDVDRIVARERAISDALAGPFRRIDRQAGLFDRRSLDADDRSRRALEAIAHDRDDRVLSIESDRLVVIGTPVLELIALPPR